LRCGLSDRRYGQQDDSQYGRKGQHNVVRGGIYSVRDRRISEISPITMKAKARLRKSPSHASATTAGSLRKKPRLRPTGTWPASRRYSVGDRRISEISPITMKAKARLRKSPSHASATTAGSLRKKTKTSTDRHMACQPKPWRRLVEAPGTVSHHAQHV
jgi:ribosomal protein S30